MAKSRLRTEIERVSVLSSKLQSRALLFYGEKDVPARHKTQRLVEIRWLLLTAHQIFDEEGV